MQNEKDATVLSIGSAAPNPEANSAWYAPLVQRLNGLTMGQKMVMGTALFVLVFSALLLLNSTRSDRADKVLFSNLSDADGASIVASLQQMGVPYEFTPGGGAIMVPKDMVYETRLKLAGQGLPKSGNVGYELLENQKFGTSQFVERINYLRGLEGELARSVASLAQVKSARVHLAVPKQTAFVREQEPASASVVVTMYPGRYLGPEQVAAITRLVSSSVPGMKSQDVSVLDTEGGMLSPNPNKSAGLDASQLKYTSEIEAAFNRRLLALLEPLAGAEGVRAQVSVDLNFDELERTSETYGKNSPPNAQSIRSQQSKESNSSNIGPGGVPGALSNQPPEPPEAPIVNAASSTGNKAAARPLRAPGEIEAGVTVLDEPDNYKKEQTTNYELDRVIERLKATKGQVRRVSAAVVLNHKQMQNPSDVQLSGKKVPFTPEELQKINELVKDAIGFVKERGDTVSVVNMPFSEEPVMESNVMTPDVVSQLLRYGAIALGVLFAYFAILRPLLKPATLKVAPTEPAMVVSEPSAPPAPSAAELMRQQMQAQQEAWELEREMQSAQREHQVRAAQQAAQEQREREMASKQKYDELVEYASQYAREHANETALLLRAWLSDSHAPAKTDVNGDHA